MVLGCLGILAFAFVAVLATAGPLFPWSPVHPGYRTERFDRATLIQPKGGRVDVGHPDTLLHEQERRTGLRFRSPVTIVVTDDWGLFTCGGLLRMDSGPVPVQGAALQTGTVIYLSPLVYERHRDPQSVLRHEMTHALLLQQMPLRRTFSIVRLDWFEEGLAVHYGNPGDYLADDAWASLAANPEYVFDPPVPHKPAGLEDEMWGSYRLTEYRQFTAFLTQRCERGYAAFRDGVLADPDRYADAYARSCREPFTAAVAAFGEAFRAGAWPVPAGGSDG